MKIKVAGVVLAGLLSLLAGCADPAEEDDGQANGNALAADEVEASVLLDHVASKDSKATGVDHWRLSLVQKAGSTELFVAALGFRGSEEVLDVVLGMDANEETHVRLQGTTLTELTPELRHAIASDMELLVQTLDQAASTSSTSTRALHPLATMNDAGTPDCSKEKTKAMLSRASVWLFGAVTAMSCNPVTVFITFAGSLPVCVVGGVATVGAVIATHATEATEKKCLAGTE